MGIVKIVDPEGGTVRLFEYEGLRYPPFPGVEKRVEKVPKTKAREDDVIISAYPRSGTNWVQEIVWMLRGQTTKIQSFTNSDLSIVGLDSHVLEALPSPRILNTHLGAPRIPCDFFIKNCKIIQVRRNPKDIMVSVYHMGKDLQFYTGGNFKGAFYQFINLRCDLYGNWFSHIKDWEEKNKTLGSNNYLILYYEDMKRDLLGHVLKLAEFLGWDRSLDFCQEVAEQCSFNLMKAGKTDTPAKENDVLYVDGKSTVFRKGEVGDWKNWFTVAQNELYDAEYQNEMQGYEHLKFTYEL